ncbi:Hypothetical protein PHPALM_14794 [Phytophthora palmivora]|uniref:SWIM-type domain-containing protein n=1 Tax=Phytophthora palmivora TaxID=4796 RepID=A0A2P4XU19_9STRA|nr:Hypothetical protein PHPALM_14794 [Phytophthora palmivora]
MEAMNTGDSEVKNTNKFRSWEDFESHFALYKKMNKINICVRSSEKRSFVSSLIHRLGLNKTKYRRSLNIRTTYAWILSEVSITRSSQPEAAYHTHSHPTTTAQATAYPTTKTLPLDEQDREDVQRIADARVSSTHVTNFLKERIGSCKATPQQTRYLIRSIMAQASGKNRLKNMLHALRQLDGSDALVIEDQMDVTYGIAIQTKHPYLQPPYLPTLIVYYWCVGCLVVITATSRGFPVIDFILLNKYAVVINATQEYFKEKNPSWEKIKTVVFDKDFVEWQILGDCFSNGDGLLCQFYVISYWKIDMKLLVYRIKVADSDQLLKRMTTLLFRYVILLLVVTDLSLMFWKDSNDAGYDELNQCCNATKKSAFFATSRKIGIRAVQSGQISLVENILQLATQQQTGSSLTWKYLKMPLGLKTRIVKAIAGLLQHQITITRQTVHTIRKHHSTTRVPKTVSTLLRAIACRLSSGVLKIAKQEWVKFVNRAETTSCERSSSLSIWKVYSMNQRYTCHDVDWSCKCLFYTSKYLPCRHLMHVADKGHGFRVLPAMSTYRKLKP